jgi:hypothetical protein
MSDYLDSNRGAVPPLAKTSNAVVSIGSGVNGTVTVLAIDSLSCEKGNSATIEVTEPAGTLPLTIVISGEFNEIITVELAVVGGVAGAGTNSALLIAAAIDAEANFSADHSGTGASFIQTPEGPHSFSGGYDIGSLAIYAVQELADSGTTESSNPRRFVKDRMHMLSVGEEPLRVLFGPVPGTGTNVPATGGAIIPANIMFPFRSSVDALYIYIEAADGSSAYEASVWQREA